jgi:hypothetical protein
MANITEEHLHHMARRHHATMQKLDGIREKISGYAQKSFGLLETGAGAWAGGMLEGRTGGMSVGPLPVNLLAGAALLVAGYANLGGERYSEHFNNLGNGFIGSYLAATGYAFGKRWKETGKILGGGGHPWTHPYENGWPKGGAEAPPKTSGDWTSGAYVGAGDLSEHQMAAIVQRMQAAAAAPAY